MKAAYATYVHMCTLHDSWCNLWIEYRPRMGHQQNRMAFFGVLWGALWSRACPQNILCWWKKLSGESIVSVSPDNLWIIDSRISSIAKTRAVGPKLQNIKLFQIRRQNKRARSAQNGGVKPINATAFENKLMLVQIQRGWVSHWLASVIGIEVKLQKCEYFYIPDVTQL